MYLMLNWTCYDTLHWLLDIYNDKHAGVYKSSMNSYDCYTSRFKKLYCKHWQSNWITSGIAIVKDLLKLNTIANYFKYLQLFIIIYIHIL